MPTSRPRWDCWRAHAGTSRIRPTTRRGGTALSARHRDQPEPRTSGFLVRGAGRLPWRVRSRDRALPAAVQLDPLARVSQLNLGESYAGSGDNRKALDIWLECARTNPDWSDAPDYISRHLVGLGRIDEALAWATKTTSLSPDRVQAGFDSGLRFPG